MRASWKCVIAAAVSAALLPWARAEIYTCIDAKGRRLTSDRPILDCIDREQSELGPTGQVIRKIGPSLTAEERAAEEEKQRRANEERNRQIEQKKKDRALLSRYPDRGTHDRERVKALAAIDEVIATANRRTSELKWQRKKLETDLEFYGNDMKRAPAHLKRMFDENDHSLAAQERFVANQEEEKKRVNARYDEELLRLNQLWAGHATQAVVPTRASSSAVH